MSLQGPLLILFGALCFSTIGTAQALGPSEASPYTVGALRLFGGGLILFFWCWFKGILPSQGGWVNRNSFACILGLTMFQVCFFASLREVGVAVGTVVAIGFVPAAVGVLGWIVLRERPTRAWYIATAFAVLGLALLSSAGAEISFNFTGIVLALVSGGFYATYLVNVKPLLRKFNATTVTMVLMLVAGLCLAPFMFVFPMDWFFTAPGLGMAAHLSFVTVALAFTLTMYGLQSTPVAVGSTLSLGEPLGAALWGIFLLKEPYTNFSLLGMALILLAVIILVLPSRAIKIPAN